jgi:ketosteroid isomerase-like protein
MRDKDAGHRNNFEILERWVEILNTSAFDEIDEVLDPDFVQEIPQSGERIRGRENMRQVMTHYPGGWQLASVARIGATEGAARYVMTPTFNLIKMEGVSDTIGAYLKIHYPDGSDWYWASFLTFRNGKIVKEVDFFAAPFDPPTSRAGWVERMEG